MEKDMEFVKKKIKNQKILLVLLSIVLVLSIGVSGYFIYDNMKEDENNSSNGINNNQQLQDGDITNTDLAKNLHKTLITSDGSYGLYTKEKLSITDTTNDYFLNFNFRDYLYENNFYDPEEAIETTSTQIFSKSNFNKYIQKKYNSKLNYYLSLDKILSVGGVKQVKSLENEYVLKKRAMSGNRSILENKLTKAEKTGDLIYLYDNVIYCIHDLGYSACYLTVDVFDCNITDDSSECVLIDEPIYECTTMEETTCTPGGPSDYKIMQAYILNNMRDKLHTFKHTFKKGTDGNYYWVSSEISK